MIEFKKIHKNIVLLLLSLIVFNSCKLGRFVFYNFADITDYKIFQSRPLHHDSVKYEFLRTDKGKFPKTFSDKNTGEISFEKYLEKNKTVAFLIIRNDTIQ